MNKLTKKEIDFLMGKVQELLDYNEVLATLWPQRSKALAQLKRHSKLYKSILAKLRVVADE